MIPVIVESPYAGKTKDDEHEYQKEVLLNVIYLRFCMHDCLINHNEAPYASHGLYTQPYVLNDKIPEQRKLGIEAGFVWRLLTPRSVFYVDLGMSSGMILGLEDCIKKNMPHGLRRIKNDVDLWDNFLIACHDEGIRYLLDKL